MSYRDRVLAPGQLVYVYRNSTADCWSVRAMDGPEKGHVIAHRDDLLLVWCGFKVSEAGRQRVIRTGHKTVHAGVIGLVAHPETPYPVALPEHLAYRPTEAARFQAHGLDGVERLVRVADAVAFKGRDVYAWGARW